MYKSPIELVVGNFQDMIIQQQENQTLQVIQKIGVNVDKEELLKALAYDREQYKKGFEDGIKEFANEFGNLLWQMKTEWLQQGDTEYATALVIAHTKLAKLLQEMVGENNELDL